MGSHFKVTSCHTYPGGRGIRIPCVRWKSVPGTFPCIQLTILYETISVLRRVIPCALKVSTWYFSSLTCAHPIWNHFIVTICHTLYAMKKIKYRLHFPLMQKPLYLDKYFILPPPWCYQENVVKLLACILNSKDIWKVKYGALQLLQKFRTSRISKGGGGGHHWSLRIWINLILSSLIQLR